MKKKIFITGHNGMVGSNLLDYFKKKYECITVIKKNLDLRNEKKLTIFLKKNKPDIIIHAAAKAGGIVQNKENKVDMFLDNVDIQSSLFKAAFKTKIKKIIFLGSSCIYPKASAIPIKEESILTGKLEETNEGYALAKISGVKLCQFYNEKYNTDYRALMPCNLYGPNDHFDKLKSHVIPALIKKFVDAKRKNRKIVYIWGSGKPLREFLHVHDLVLCVEKLIKLKKNKFKELSNKKYIINIGSEQNISIKRLADMIKKIIKFKGKVIFDLSKPDGVYNKKLDCTKLKKIIKKINNIPLNIGIEKVIKEYERNLF